MSLEAITWALQQEVERSTAKFVLVAMANYADADMLCWPSVECLSKATCQDRKTVLENMRRLREWGFISDTGQRKGSTGQVIVFHLNSTESGIIKQSQKRNSTENGTVPKTDGNSPVFPPKQSRKRTETVLKTGHGTVYEPPKEPSGKQKGFTLPNWIPVDAWNGYLEMRKKKRKEPTDRARDLVIADLLKFKEAGYDLEEILNKSTKNGWTDVYAPKPNQQASASPSGKLGKAGQETANNAKKWLEEQGAG